MFFVFAENTKMEHSDLVAEMSQVERLTTQERLHLAKRFVIFVLWLFVITY